MSINTKTSASVKKRASRIMLGTNPGIESNGKLYRRLKQCAARETDVDLYASSVESIDTIALQLLLAFVQQVRKNGNTLTWKSPSEAFLTTVRLLGLEAELLLADYEA